MAIQIRIPAPLQSLTQNQSTISLAAESIRDMVVRLEAEYPGMKERLCDESGQLRRYINIYVNDEDIRCLQNDETPLTDGDEVYIIPAIAGG